MSAGKKAGAPILVLRGVVMAVLLTLVLLLPAALVIYRGWIPEKTAPLLAALCVGTALLCGVLLLGRKGKRAAALAGLILAGYLLPVCLLGFCLCGTESWRGIGWCALAAAAGTVLGIMVSGKKRGRKKKRGAYRVT